MKKWIWIAPSAGLFSSLFTTGLLSISPAHAQIVPDSTLPTNSRVVPGCTNCTIEGGTLRGANLFHSFLQFSVPTGGQAYFNNSLQVQNILTRVTGSSASSIDGLLRTNGSANLFLLNPNGILFGPNARLDIGGSFLATTANSFKFSDGSEFSATNPQAPPLLNVNLTPGLQYGGIRPGSTIASTGSLKAGQDLTLVADRLDLQGQLQAGGNLTLKAVDSVRIRDTAQIPFIAVATGDLLVQGDRQVDIFALNHPNSGFFAGGDLTLRSTAAVSGDAYFNTGGNFQIEQMDGTPGGWLSPNDPIVRATGNVVFDTYIGESLHIFAGGSVTANNIVITGADGTNGLVDQVTLSDGTVLAIDGRTAPTLDIRAGTTDVGSPLFTPNPPAGFVTGLPTTTGAPPTGDITINGVILVDQPGSVVLLTNQYRPRTDVNPGNILFTVLSNQSTTGNGTIAIDSRGSITLNNALVTVAADSTSAAGTIALLADGPINITPTGYIQSFGGFGSDVRLTSRSGITIQGSDPSLFSIQTFNARATAGGTGGNVALSAPEIRLLNAGNINAITLGAVASGDVSLRADRLIALDGSRAGTATQARGSAGATTIATPVLTLNNSNLETQTLAAGTAGIITIGGFTPGSRSESVSLTNLSQINSSVAATARGNAGVISIQTQNLSVTGGGQINASTRGSGDGGRIRVDASDSIRLNGVNPNGVFSGIISTAESGATGNGGSSTLKTNRLQVTDGAQIRTTTRGPGNAGNVSIEADTIAFDGVSAITRQPSAITSTVLSGGTGEGGSIDIKTRTLSFTNGARISAETNSTIATPTKGNAGSITIKARETAEFDGIGSFGANTGARVETFGAGRGGKLTVEAADLSVTNGAQLRSNTNGQGDAGDIKISVSGTVLIDGNDSGLFATTSSSSTGKGGSVVIDPQQVILRNGAKISVDSLGSGVGGNVQIESGRLILSDRARISAETSSNDGGNIVLQIRDYLLLRRGSLISTNAGKAQGLGNGGDINIDSTFVVAVPEENSDITANAFRGRGGNVTIETQGIFGIAFRPVLTPFSDITASSEFGVDGIVSITTPEIDPSRGLLILPANLVDASRLVAQTCSTRSVAAAQQRGAFVVTGRGGLPPGPGDALNQPATWQDIRPVGPTLPKTTPSRSDQTPLKSSSAETIVEADAWTIGTDGKVMLTAKDAVTPTGEVLRSATSPNSWTASSDCQNPPSMHF